MRHVVLLAGTGAIGSIGVAVGSGASRGCNSTAGSAGTFGTIGATGASRGRELGAVELVHLLVADHGPAFEAWMSRYPRLLEARAFLAGVEKLIEDFTPLAGDRYFAERASDLYDLEKRILRHLLGERREELMQLTAPVVVLAL